MRKNNAKDRVEVKKRYYKSGALWWESQYENGKRHGIDKFYYESGALLVETPYVNGEEQGISRGYYESGALQNEIPYVRGEIHGIVRDYEEGNSNIGRLALYDKGHKVASVKFSIKGDRS
jgi:antitoxin component YwqK of YwqJK toxin-antitoxin module